MTILIVDDSRAMRMILMRSLRQAGYGAARIVEAADGDQAMALVKTHAPDLILCDWNMPGRTGLEVLDALRKEGCRAVFGFVTTEGTPDMKAKAHGAGAAFLVAKPFTADVFKLAVDSALRRAA